MILIIDNYDSFTYNLVQYVGVLTDVAVVKNDDDSLGNMAEKADALIFSPGRMLEKWKHLFSNLQVKNQF